MHVLIITLTIAYIGFDFVCQPWPVVLRRYQIQCPIDARMTGVVHGFNNTLSLAGILDNQSILSYKESSLVGENYSYT